MLLGGVFVLLELIQYIKVTNSCYFKLVENNGHTIADYSVPIVRLML